MNEQTEYAQDRLSILVVDDSRTVLSQIEGVLESAGNYQINCRESAEEALELLQSTAPNLIILDVKMPGIDGFEACRRIKTDPRLSSIPIVFVTALNDTINRMEGYRAGGIDYISKPVDGNELLDRVKKHITAYSERKQSQELLDQLCK